MIILKGHTEPIQRLEFAPDGTSLLSIDRSDTFRVWDLSTGKARWSNEVGFYDSVVFTPGGSHVLSCNRDRSIAIDQGGDPRSELDVTYPIQVRETSTGKAGPAPIVYDPACGYFNLTVSPTGDCCVANRRSISRGLWWWSLPSGQPLPTWENVVPHELLWFPAMAFSPNGRILAGMNAGGVHLFDVPNGKLLFEHRFKTMQDECRLAFHPAGRLLAIGSGTRMAILDIETRTEVGEIKQAKKYFLQAVFTPDGRYLATVSNEATVKFWDTAGWQLAKEYAWEVGGLRCLAFSRDGLVAATGGMKNRVVVWDLDD